GSPRAASPPGGASVSAIAGVFDRALVRPSAELLVAMRDVMVHRGPDDGGIVIAPGIGLAHRRLGSLEGSPAARQPLASEDQSLWVTSDGALHDSASVHEELRAAGRALRSQSDAEVLLHAYAQWGTEGMLRRLHGIFAFALWDARAQRLVLARDRLGGKPLYYAQLAERLYFASDLKGIWVAVRDRLGIDHEALDEFLHYFFVTQDRSIYREVKKVPPAGFIEVDRDGALAGSYWEIDYTRTERCDEREWLERCRRALRRVVERRMVDGARVGALLSGGLNSSLVVALMAEASPAPVKTFSVAFGGGACDETPRARRVAERLGAEHHELRVEPEVWDLLPELVWHYGEPFADPSGLASSLVARTARDEMKVALCGDGGDEVFAGHPSYAAVYRGERCWWVPRWMRERMLIALGHAAQARWPQSSLAARVKSLGDHLSGDPLRLLDRGMGWDTTRREALYTHEMRRLLDGWHPAAAQARHLAEGIWETPTDGWRLAVLKSLLPADCLVRIDVAGVMSAIEVRCPFLDAELIELTARIPSEVLLGPRTEPKAFLKQLAAQVLPGECLALPERPCALPIDAWMRGPWLGAVRRLLLSERAMARGYFRREAIDELLTQHARGVDQRHRIWSLLWLEVWHLMFVDGVLSPGDRLPLQ
ncbi:MAG: asparagine synthase (glutamine-hydrolyzing), partial [Thermodesulfobacteriota bacterium]